MFNENATAPQVDPTFSVTVIGDEFTADAEANIEISRLAGTDSGMFGGMMLRESAASEEWEPGPNYSDDAALCLEMLEQHGIVPFILPTEEYKQAGGRRKKAFIQEYVGVFELDGVMYCTVPQMTEDAAAACVLWFVLSKSQVTCFSFQNEVCCDT